jgi:hypothetical protein
MLVFRTILRVAFTISILIAVTSAAVMGATVADVVSQVSQANYTDILYNQLFTHVGDNRSVKGGAQHDPAAANIFISLRRSGLTTMYDPFTYTTSGTTYDCKNIIAIKQGTTNPDDIYIVGAHYDSTGYSGADDNASGVAGVLEAARVMARYDFASTVIFCAFDCEEWGLYGGAHMAADYANANIRAMVSLDMISWNMPSKPNQALLYGNSSTIKQAFGTAMTTYSNGITWSDGGDWAASDQYPFETRGFSTCWLYEAQKQGNTSIHGPNDNVDRTDGYIDYAYATKMTRGLVGYMATAAGFIGPGAFVPEPGGVVVLAMALCCLAGFARRATARR